MTVDTPTPKNKITSGPPANTYKFDKKERDAETGNDNFGARFYISRFGRFLSVDWSAVPAPVPYANLTNPQSLNLYAFVSDNPATFADLDGHFANTSQGGEAVQMLETCPAPDRDCELAYLQNTQTNSTEDMRVEEKQQEQTVQQQQQTQNQYASYDVQGATASEAMANANMSAHGGCMRAAAGCTHAEFLEKPDTTVTGQQTSSGFSVTGTVSSVNVTVSITTTLPHWTGYAAASASEQKAWDSSLAALKSHEAGHAAIDRASVQTIKSAIQGTTASASGNSLQQTQSRMLAKLGALVQTRFKAAVAANQRRNDDYDLAH